MILVLLPFWTSVLVRVASWIVLLQQEGLINSALMGLGIIGEPLQLAFNRTGVYIAMVHILLPFVILPAYSVMKSIPPTYMRAAISLGDHPFAAFWKIYFPQTVHYPGTAGRPARADGQLLRRVLHQRHHQLGHGRGTGLAAAGCHHDAVRGVQQAGGC
jgi:hypothetical protein